MSRFHENGNTTQETDEIWLVPKMQRFIHSRRMGVFASLSRHMEGAIYERLDDVTPPFKKIPGNYHWGERQ